ncbi:MAG: nucleoside hydrolase, partial [Planctomycetota bacterium]|jgi:inosine-uridine nucleoside N-ribohydrolase
MKNRTLIILASILIFLGQLGCTGLQPQGYRATKTHPIPVIFDTDIGGDIDDTWALAFILASPELDLKLVVTDYGNTEQKAIIAAKFLHRAGRTDVPVGIGTKQGKSVGAQIHWAKDYNLDQYPGTVHQDGVQAMIDTIMNSKNPITLIATGPVPSVRDALKREPRIAKRCRLIVMGGSFDLRKPDKPNDPIPECNVLCSPIAARIAYGAEWDVTMAPLDSAGQVVLAGEQYARVRNSKNPTAKALMENYNIWYGRSGKGKPAERSSTLFDTVAVYLAFADEFLQMRDMHVRVTKQRTTVTDSEGKLTHVAMGWKNIDAFYKLLASRIADYR